MWWSSTTSEEPKIEEMFDIWMKSVDSIKTLNQRVSDITMATGLEFKKTHMGNDIILRYGDEEFKVRVWIPLRHDDLTEILSGFYKCEIVRTTSTSPGARTISYTCRTDTDES